MLRYLPGLILIQLVAVVLLHVNAGAAPMDLLVRAGLPCAVVTLVMALWFSTLSSSRAEERLAALIEAHAREREQLKVEAVEARERVQVDALHEREKVQQAARREQDKAVDKVRRDAEKRERRVSRGASLKVGATFFTTACLGVLMLLTELLTLGLLTLSTSAGALGGYLLRWRQTKQLPTEPSVVRDKGEPRVIGQTSLPAIESRPLEKDTA
jgi:Flp pilus assembly protein TadB